MLVTIVTGNLSFGRKDTSSTKEVHLRVQHVYNTVLSKFLYVLKLQDIPIIELGAINTPIKKKWQLCVITKFRCQNLGC
jgi:hypothetical protein